MALTDNIVAYWKLDESSGNAADEVGGLTLTNTSTTYAAGKINNGASFDGSTSKLQSSSNIGISGAGARTIACWAKTSNTARQALVGWGGTTSGLQSVLEAMDSDGRLYFVGYGAAADLDGGASAIVADGNWHFCVFTYDGTDGKLYLDGSQVGSTKALTLNTTDTALTIGAERPSSSLFWLNGMVDEVGIWSRALISTEITELYNSGAGLQYPFSGGAPIIIKPNLLTLGVG